MKLSLFVLLLCFSGYLVAQNLHQTDKQTSSIRLTKDYYGQKVLLKGNYAVVLNSNDEYNALGNIIESSGYLDMYKIDAYGNWHKTQQIRPSKKYQFDNFGFQFALSDKYLAVGAAQSIYPGLATISDRGLVFIYELDSSGLWIEKQILNHSSPEPNGKFGQYMVMNDSVLVVMDDYSQYISGQQGITHESRLIMYRLNAAGQWVENQIIQTPAGNTDSPDFGEAMSLSENYLLVGMVNNHFNSAETDSLYAAGCAYIYQKNASNQWDLLQKITPAVRAKMDWFGASVEINDSIAAILAPLQDTDENGLNPLQDRGAVYIFIKDASGIWQETQKIVAPNRAPQGNLGNISMSDNELLIGSANSLDENELNNRTGAYSAYYFKRNAQSGIWQYNNKIVASDRDYSDLFGQSLDIDHGKAIVGAQNESEDRFERSYVKSSGSVYFFATKGVTGQFFLDLNGNCIKDANERGLPGKRLIIQPGNIQLETSSGGIWHLDSLPAGNYTIVPDSTNHWMVTCAAPLQFTITDPSQINLIAAVGMQQTQACIYTGVTTQMALVRTCRASAVYVEATNENYSTDKLTNGYVDVVLDSALMFQTASLPAVDLGNNTYRFSLDTLFPGEKITFHIGVTVSCFAETGQSICNKAEIFPSETCVLDTIAADSYPDFEACQLPWDQSSLTVTGSCVGDSITFVVSNAGTGNMNCYSPIRIYQNGTYILLDSVQLNAGENRLFTFSADGSSFMLQADQHPLHPGKSKPNALVEDCGSSGPQTASFINVYPPDDADPQIDINCNTIISSFDPNDKSAVPIGLGIQHKILPNCDLEYLIRFQNTGNDTAFTVVIRDTLDQNLDPLTVTSGVSSHPYIFTMYGNQIVEWVFNNILLPDSTTNEEMSHGFVSFRVSQDKELPDGTNITNEAAIYFDYNVPVITNAVSHLIDRGLRTNSYTERQTSNLSACDTLAFNGQTYTHTGTYYQTRSGSLGVDTLMVINLNINNSKSTLYPSVCGSYQAPDGQLYTASGSYQSIIPNALGCDSIISIHLTVQQPSTSVINTSACVSYSAPDGQIYNASGNYTAIIPNAVGCDSIISIHLSIMQPTSSFLTETRCGNYLAPDGQLYSTSGLYTAIIPNVQGCDSTISIDLTILQASSNSISEIVCGSYTAPDGQVYTSSGQYTAIIPNASGCDSIITINLAVKQPSVSSRTESICSNNYSAPDGQVYSTSGQYTAIIPNAAGCDSTITINLSLNQPSASSITESICSNNYSAPDGQVYSTSGQYTAIIPNAAGCDSTITINLLLKQPTTSILNESVCDSYTAPDGQIYTSSGNYTAIIANTVGCDSTITISLTVKQSGFSNVTETACQYYQAADGQIYTQSGNYTATIPNASGCDSTITYQLTIHQVDTSLTVLEPMASSNAIGGNYQWLDCQNGMQPISGATQQDFQATQDGVYAVIIEINGCTDTSACREVNLVGMQDITQTEFKLYPNPGNGTYYLDLGQNHQISSVQISDVTGRIIRNITIGSDQVIVFELHEANGMYQIHLLDEQKQSIAVLNLMKE